MLATFYRPGTARQFYFALSNAFQLTSPILSPTYKMAGLYSIHKNKKCYYVGQSKNLPSRIADHLTGRYEPADEFRVYFVCEEYFYDFYKRTKGDQKSILETNELKLIQTLKPIDNIRVNNDAHISDERLFLSLRSDSHYEHAYDLKCYIDELSISVWDGYGESAAMVDERIVEEYCKFFKESRNA